MFWEFLSKVTNPYYRNEHSSSSTIVVSAWNFLPISHLRASLFYEWKISMILCFYWLDLHQLDDTCGNMVTLFKLQPASQPQSHLLTINLECAKWHIKNRLMFYSSKDDDQRSVLFYDAWWLNGLWCVPVPACNSLLWWLNGVWCVPAPACNSLLLSGTS